MYDLLYFHNQIGLSILFIAKITRIERYKQFLKLELTLDFLKKYHNFLSIILKEVSKDLSFLKICAKKTRSLAPGFFINRFITKELFNNYFFNKYLIPGS